MHISIYHIYIWWDYVESTQFLLSAGRIPRSKGNMNTNNSINSSNLLKGKNRRDGVRVGRRKRGQQKSGSLRSHGRRTRYRRWRFELWLGVEWSGGPMPQARETDKEACTCNQSHRKGQEM